MANELNADPSLLKAIVASRHSPIRNYALPGVTSWLLGPIDDNPANGKLRMFTSDRHQQENVTPHSHRFDFQAWVLRGTILNRVWRTTKLDGGDSYVKRTLRYSGAPGAYQLEVAEPTVSTTYCYADSTYVSGDTYGMLSHEIHSIWFSRDAIVVIQEGPIKQDYSFVLEPWVDGHRIPLMRVDPWMFKR